MSQQSAAAKSGVSVRSARRIEARALRVGPKPRHWRTRTDPLAPVWDSEIVPLLRQVPGLTAVSVLEQIERRHGTRFGASVLRTLQRRMRRLRALEGPEREVYFAQEHEPGRLGLSDFTDARELKVQIAGELLNHRLYQFALAYSGWRHAEVVLGGESYVALAGGLQNALWCLGGVPLEHRTDSLSAAYNNLAEQETLSARYEALCAGYGMRASRNNPAASHENGSIEARQRTIKHFLEQALLLRGVREFANLEQYRAFVAEVVQRANRRVVRAVAIERACLMALPRARLPEYEQLDARVTKYGLITVKTVAYSVPSRLIGYRLKVRLYDDRLEAWLGDTRVLACERLRKGADGARVRQIDYRHMLAALKRKPAALVRWRLRESLFPRSEYAMTWERLRHALPERAAARVMIGLLEIAAEHHCEAALAQSLAQLEAEDKLPDLEALGAQFAPRICCIPSVEVNLPSLELYDALMSEAP